VRVPMGVIAVIFESRPNVAFDVFALCLKTRNACVLKGSSDAHDTNLVAVSLMQQALSDHGFFGAVSLADYDDAFKDVVNFAVTEKRTQEEIERFAAVLGGL